MKGEIKGHEYHLRKVKKQYQNRINFIQQASIFRIEALESVIQEQKLQASQDRERLQMEVEEIHSRTMHKYKSVGQLDDLITQCDEKLILSNVQQARIIIKSLVNVIKGNRDIIEKYEDTIRNGNGSIEQFNLKLQEMKEQKEQTDQIRLYYQRIVMKLCRDLQVVQDEEIDIVEQFMKINEDKADLDQMKDDKDFLENQLDIRQVMVDHVNKMYGFKTGLG